MFVDVRNILGYIVGWTLIGGLFVGIIYALRWPIFVIFSILTMYASMGLAVFLIAVVFVFIYSRGIQPLESWWKRKNNR